MFRQTNVPNIALTQVGHEGNPTETTTLTVAGTLDGTPSLQVAIPHISARTLETINSGA